MGKKLPEWGTGSEKSSERMEWPLKMMMMMVRKRAMVKHRDAAPLGGHRIMAR